MQLPHLFKKPAVSKPVYFFAIHLSDSVVQSALWKVEQGLIEVVSRSTQKSWQDDESCVVAIDQSLQDLSKEAEHVKETLFALSPEWVTAEGILPAKKHLFQKITKELSLEAIGFVVTTEALLQHFTQTLSPQLSLFLIEVAATQLFITQVKLGNLEQTEKVGRSGEVVSDMVEGFARFKDKIFPSKFLLYSSVLQEAELEEIRQSLFNHDWPKDYPFLHPPVIDIFAPDHVLEIIIQTGGRAVAESKGLSLLKLPEMKPVAEGEAPLAVTQMTNDLVADDLTDSTSLPTAFVPPVTTAEPLTAAPVGSTADAQSNVAAVEEQEIDLGTSRPVDQMPAASLESATKSTTESEATSETDSTDHALAGKSPSSTLAMHRLLPFLIGGVVIGLVLLLGIGVIASIQFKKALITLQLDTKPLSKEVSLTLDPTAQSSDPTKLLLKATTVTKDVQGIKTAQSTGSKIIGDKAKGSVTLYNRTSNQQSFAAGTVLSDGTHTYTLDTATSVASASSGSDPSIINVGTVNATVTAVVIGTDSNIAKSTSLTIANFSKDSYFAQVSADLTGGTSREILAVSADDQAKLKASLLQDLTAQAAAGFKTDSTGGAYIVPTNQVKIVKSTFSADVGTEADTFSLSLQIQVLGLSYATADLNPIATQLLSADAPTGYLVKTDQLSVLSQPVQPTSSASAQVSLLTNISSIAVPTIQLDQLKQQVAGKSFANATQILHQQLGVKSETILETPALFKLFSSAIPTKINNITITLKY